MWLVLALLSTAECQVKEQPIPFFFFFFFKSGITSLISNSHSSNLKADALPVTDDGKCPKILAYANSADPDQTAPQGAV